MRQLPSDKYNVAWFKLAEFVSRGERERALCLYKLLAHSFDDYALAAQLEGDILLAFNDTKGACQRYRDAVSLFKEAKRFIEAVAVYEHILMLEVVIEDLLDLIILYSQLGIPARMQVHCQQLCIRYIEMHKFDDLQKFLDEWMSHLAHEQKAQLYVTISLTLIKNKNSSELILGYLKDTVQFLLGENTPSSLQTFLSTLEVLNEDYYWYAAEQVQER